MREIFDTHTHLYLQEFDADRQDTMQRSTNCGVKIHMLPNVDTSTITPLRELLAAQPHNTIGAMGLHPTAVDDNWKKNLSIIHQELLNYPYHAVGEVGIDLYWEQKYLAQQQIVFAQQIEWALTLDLPLIIHCREAFNEIFDTLNRYQGEPLRGIFHSFAGGEEEINKVLSVGDFYFGINGTLTYKKSSQRDILSLIPHERLVIETDAPYLAPIPFRGKRNEPAYLNHVISTLATTLSISEAEVAKLTYDNSYRLFLPNEEKKPIKTDKFTPK